MVGFCVREIKERRLCNRVQLHSHCSLDESRIINLGSGCERRNMVNLLTLVLERRGHNESFKLILLYNLICTSNSSPEKLIICWFHVDPVVINPRQHQVFRAELNAEMIKSAVPQMTTRDEL